MRKFQLLALLFLLSIILKAQTPQGFSYQAVVRNGTGTPIADKTVGLKITIQDTLQVVYYTEIHSPKSNAQGVISVTIGRGSRLGIKSFTSIPWQLGKIFIKAEIDPEGGTNYLAMGVPTKLQSVPYALYAENSKEIVSKPNASDDDPIFVVRNKAGQIVFAVYQTGARVYVEDSHIIKGARGGFAVGGLSQTKAGTTPEYFRVTSDSARIYVNNSNSKGARGGFAVGGLSQTKGGKGSTNNFLDLTPENSFIGQDAGKSNTTGERNAFIGYQAGYSNSDGFDNIFVGNTSGLSNVSGASNIFLGTGSGKNNTTGRSNIFLGTSSGEQNTTGMSNISIGSNAGQGLTTGLKNIFIGVESGFSNSVGSDNVFIGNYAGNANTSSSNVFIGRTSGLMNTTGTNNVFVGEQTGRMNIEGSGNVFLGDQAGISEMGSNKLYISNSSTTTPLVYGEFDNGKVEVNGSIKLKDLLNLKPKTSYPGNPAEGDIFYDATTHSIKFFDGTGWKELTSAPTIIQTPSVSTVSIPAMTILSTSCIVNCNISNTGGSDIVQSGVRYSTTPFFDTQSGSTVTFPTPGVGDFSVTLTSLFSSRVYYVRSFATNNSGTSLGNMMTFKTPAANAMPSITSNPVLEITQTSAITGGNISLPGGKAITAQGICWSTTSIPTIANEVVSANIGLGIYTCNITSLTTNTTYFVRAYATNGNGTAYGDEVIFTTASAITKVFDIDNNEYNTVQIGTQTWMKENLKTTKYRNGSIIDNISDNTLWINQTSGAYCWYNNDADANKDTYGALYNYYATVDNRNLCPTGWHVPTDADWTNLTNYLGGLKVAGRKLKETGTLHWIEPNTEADNSSGFNALPGGTRSIIEPEGLAFRGINEETEWWTITTYNINAAVSFYINEGLKEIQRYNEQKNSAVSVRCLMDK